MNIFRLILIGCISILFVKIIFIGKWSAPNFSVTDSRHSIDIRGDDEYRNRVSSCLDILASKASEEYEFIEKNIDVISQGEKSGMFAWETPTRYQMSDRTAFYSVTWCASTIAHDAYHSFLYKMYILEDGTQPSYQEWAGFSAEKEAIKFQLKTMEKIGSATNEVEYLKGLNGTHGDVNRDGEISNEDYEKRTW